jgi:hypothetical protein
MIVPKFGLFISLTGSFACTCLAFILPIRMYDILHYDLMSVNRRYFHNFLIVIGCIAGTISFIVSTKELIKAFGSPEDGIVANVTLPVNSTETNLTGDGMLLL